MITNAQSGTRIDEIAALDLPHLDAGERRPGGLQLQPVPDRGRGAAALPHRAAPHVPARPGGDRRRPAGRAAALGRPSRTSRRTSAARSTTLLAAAPEPGPLCSRVAAMVSVDDLADRPARALADGETLGLGRRARPVAGRARTCPTAGSAATSSRRRRARCSAATSSPSPGAEHPPLTEGDILGPSEAMRAAMDYFAHSAGTRPLLAEARRHEPEDARLHARERLVG